MEKLFLIIKKTEEWFGGIVLGVMTVVTFLAAANRFTIAIPMPWSEELVRILVAWLTFVGAAIGIREGAHIGINVITDHLPSKIQKFVLCCIPVAGMVVCAFMIYGGTINLLSQITQKTQALQISIGWKYASVPVGAFLMGIEFLRLFVQSVAPKGNKAEKTAIEEGNNNGND